MPDPSSWLRNVKMSDVGAHTANVSFDWDLSYLLNGKQSGETTTTGKSTDGYTYTVDHHWSVAYGTPVTTRTLRWIRRRISTACASRLMWAVRRR